MAEVLRRVTVDRIEGSIAVLLDGDSQVDVPVAWLPSGAGEGAALTVTLALDAESEDALRARIKATQQRLVSGGDDEIDL